MEKYQNTPERQVPTYVLIDTSKDLYDTLGELELVEENGVAEIIGPMSDNDVYYLIDISQNEGFRNIKELYLNPIDLSSEARYELTSHAKTYFEYFPELHFIDDDGNKLSEVEIDLIKAA